MCRLFEEVSGKVSRGSVEELRGLTKFYMDNGMKVAIINIPVDMMEIDARYQTEFRTERDLNYLTSKWNENKLLPLIGVPHWDEGKVYIVDGYGRWIGSQIVNKEKYKDLAVQLILNAPTEEEARLTFEAEMFAFQNKQVAPMKPVHTHGARLIMKDKATVLLEKLSKEYDFGYSTTHGRRKKQILGSYTDIYNICKVDGEECARYIFDVLREAGFDRKSDGYSRYVVNSVRDMWRCYPENRAETKSFLISFLRGIYPQSLKAWAVTKYPKLYADMASSMYLEDVVVKELKLTHTRAVSNNKVVPIAEYVGA